MCVSSAVRIPHHAKPPRSEADGRTFRLTRASRFFRQNLRQTPRIGGNAKHYAQAFGRPHSAWISGFRLYSRGLIPADAASTRRRSLVRAQHGPPLVPGTRLAASSAALAYGVRVGRLFLASHAPETRVEGSPSFASRVAKIGQPLALARLKARTTPSGRAQHRPAACRPSRHQRACRGSPYRSSLRPDGALVSPS